MAFFVAFIVLVVSYIVKFKEDFEKDKLEKAGTLFFVFCLIIALLAWLLS